MQALPPAIVSGQVPAIARAAATRHWPTVLRDGELRALAISVSGQVWPNSPNRTVGCSAYYGREHNITRVRCQVNRPSGSYAVFETRGPGTRFRLWEDGSYRLALTGAGLAT